MVSKDYIVFLLVLMASDGAGLVVNPSARKMYCRYMESRGFSIDSCSNEAVLFGDKLCLKVRELKQKQKSLAENSSLITWQFTEFEKDKRALLSTHFRTTPMWIRPGGNPA